MTEREKRFQEAHESMTRSLGRNPTRTEMCGAMGWSLYSSHCYRLARKLGLTLYAERIRTRAECGKKEPEPEKKTPAQIAKEKREANVQTFANREVPNMQRIMAIREGTGIGEGKGWGHSPAEGYGVADCRMIVCPVCGMRKLIAPRMHPFWLRDAQGKVVFVCSRPCTGQYRTL